MKILGITGGIGSGKTTVTRLFEQLGATVIDADGIAHQILEKGGSAYTKVLKHFGNDILTAEEEIDRKKLAGIVFLHPEQLQELNDITHPCIFKEMERQIRTATSDLVCLDVPLLFSSAFPIACDKTLAVVAPKDLRISRVMQRDHTTKEAVEQRMRSQLADETLKRLADFCIHNDGEEADLAMVVKEIYHKMMELSK